MIQPVTKIPKLRAASRPTQASSKAAITEEVTKEEQDRASNKVRACVPPLLQSSGIDVFFQQSSIGVTHLSQSVSLIESGIVLFVSG